MVQPTKTEATMNAMMAEAAILGRVSRLGQLRGASATTHKDKNKPMSDLNSSGVVFVFVFSPSFHAHKRHSTFELRQHMFGRDRSDQDLPSHIT